MEAAVEVALPLESRLMGSPEGFGCGGVVVGEVRCHAEGACSSRGRNDDIHAANVSALSFWRNIPNAERCAEVSLPSCVRKNDALNDHNLGNIKSNPTRRDMDVKLLVQKSGKIERKNSWCTKRSRMAQMESSKNNPGSHDVIGIPPELVTSSSACCNSSEKSQLINKRDSSTSKRGDKRNNKVKHKNRCDSFSLKNGLIGFNSAAGGNNFFGMYGLKPEVFDITKFVNEPSCDELLHGSYTHPCIAKDKRKKAESSNNDLLQSVRNACSVLQARKISRAQNCAKIDNSCIHNVFTGLTTVNSAVGQTDGEKGDSGAAVLSSSQQVQQSDDKIKIDKIKMSNLANSPLYKPEDILERLALPPPKDLDMLLCDASKNPSSSKGSTDPRLGKLVALRTGLPLFSWSHSFSGHSKVVSDTAKLSTSRTACHGRWVKVKNSFALQKCSADLLADFESLEFDQNLVPSFNLMSEHRENKIAPVECILTTSGACSTSNDAADEHSPIHTAAQTLLDMAACSEGNPCAVTKLMKKPSQMTMKTSKSKAVKRPNFFDVPKPIIRPANISKLGDYGFSSKKLRLSTDVPNTYIDHMETTTKGKLHQSVLLSVKSPPRKVFMDSNASTDCCSTKTLKKFITRTPRGADMPGRTKLKFWRPSH